MTDLNERYERDKETWDECAESYERHIVSGHPDIRAFEQFEEDFLDRVLRYLCKCQDRPVKLMDIGCGSGRLHMRYAAKTSKITAESLQTPLGQLKMNNPEFAYDPLLAENLEEVWGIDFSSKMIELANQKLKEYNLETQSSLSLNFVQGSAFEMNEEPDYVFPVAISLVNSISVMQGPAGAIELFKSMRRVVENAGGIAIISCYQNEYIESYGLGQYESTLDVSGQPWWLIPETYASPQYLQVAHAYKQSYSTDETLPVSVFDMQGNLVKKNHVLERDPKRTSQVVQTGLIRTHTNYESQWYSYRQIEDAINNHWNAKAYHIKTKQMDRLRAEPSQLAILDCGDHLEPLLKHWEIICDRRYNE